MTEITKHPLFSALTAILGTLVGGFTVYDRMEASIAAKVKLESKVTKLTEQVESLKGDVWLLRQKSP